MNGWHTSIPGCWGGHMDYGLFVHAFFTLLPPGQYFTSHPEYYSLTGDRWRAGWGPICLSHTDMLRLVTQRVLENMRQNPEARLFPIS